MKIIQLIIFLTSTIFQFNCTNQKINHVSLVFLKKEIKSEDALYKMKDELFYHNLTDSLSLTGQSHPIIVIELSREQLLRYGLTKKKVHEIVKLEITSSLVEPEISSNIIINAKDLENHRNYNNYDALGNLAIEIVQSGMVIRLKDIAKISSELYSPSNRYQGEEVEVLSFKFLGKTKGRLDETLKSIEDYGMRYKVIVNQPMLKLDEVK